MPYILLGEPCYRLYADTLRSYDFTPVPLMPDARLNKTVRTHADTLMYSDGTVHIANADYATSLPEKVRELLIKTPDTPYGDYPTDTVFNALRVGRYLFARTASLSPTVRRAAEESGLTLVNVNQGYAHCSTLPLSSARAAVTADEGMAKAMEACGIRVLRIACGHIALEGCEYGFIGGASFVYEPRNCCSLSRFSRYVFFFGDLHRHPDGNAVKEFITSLGYEVISLGGALTDFGGAVIV